MLYKVYSYNNIYKFTLSGDRVFSKFSFSSQINWWQWTATLQTNFQRNEASIIYGDIVKVYDNMNLLYTWFVVWIKRKFTKNMNNTEYSLVWIGSIFTQKLYEVWWSYIFAKNAEPKDIIEEIISKVNANHNLFTHVWTIATYWSNILVNYDNVDCFSAINTVIDTTGRKRHIDSKGVFRCWTDTQFTTHLFKLQEDIEEVTINEDWTNLVNDMILKTSSWTYSWNDATSQTLYWIRQKYINNSSLDNWPTVTARQSTYFEDNADTKAKMTLVFNRKNSTIDTVIPWDIINIQNTNDDLRNLKVSAIKWDIEKVTVEIKLIENYTQILQS